MLFPHLFALSFYRIPQYHQLFVVKAISSTIIIKLQQQPSLWLLLSLSLLLCSRGTFIYANGFNTNGKFVNKIYLPKFPDVIRCVSRSNSLASFHLLSTQKHIESSIHRNTYVFVWVGLAWLDLASFLSSVEKYSTVSECVCVCESVYACVKFISPHIYYGTWPFSLTNYLMAWQIIAIFFFCRLLLWAYIFDVISVARLWDIFHRIELFSPCNARTYKWMNEKLWLWFAGTTNTLYGQSTCGLDTHTFHFVYLLACLLYL